MRVMAVGEHFLAFLVRFSDLFAKHYKLRQGCRDGVQAEPAYSANTTLMKSWVNGMRNAARARERKLSEFVKSCLVGDDLTLSSLSPVIEALRYLGYLLRMHRSVRARRAL